VEPTAGVPEIEGDARLAGTEGSVGGVTGVGAGDGVGAGVTGGAVVMTGSVVGACLVGAGTAGCLALLRRAFFETRAVAWRITGDLQRL